MKNEETVYWDDDKKHPIIPILPFYSADGNVVVEKWEEEFTDRVGNQATVSYLKFKNKKGKISDPVVYLVKWR
jgi:hypothetical protein